MQEKKKDIKQHNPYNANFYYQTFKKEDLSNEQINSRNTWKNLK